MTSVDQVLDATAWTILEATRQIERAKLALSKAEAEIQRDLARLNNSRLLLVDLSFRREWY